MARLHVHPTPEHSFDYVNTVEEADYYLYCIDEERARARLALKELDIDKENLLSHRGNLYKERLEKKHNI